MVGRARIKGLAASLIIGLVMAPAAAAEQVDRQPLILEFVEDLRFGVIVKDRARFGEVVIDATTGRKWLRGGAYDFGGHHARAELRLIGEPDAPYVVLVPDSIPLGEHWRGAELSDLVVSPGRFGRLGPDGRATIFIGATLKVLPTMAPGDYTVTFHMTADYR